MKLSRFRRKNFTPLKKRKSSKRRRQIKRRPTKKFNIRKTHNMKGGGGEAEPEAEPEARKMAILNKEDIARIKAMKGWRDSIQDKIDAIKPVADSSWFRRTIANDVGIELRKNPNEDSNEYVIHTTPGASIYITKRLYPNIDSNIYEQVSEIYENAEKSGLKPVPSHTIPNVPNSGILHDRERDKYVGYSSDERPTKSLQSRLRSAFTF